MTFVKAVTELILGGGPSTLAAPVQQSPDLADQVRKLAELGDSEILTEAEFEAETTELLAKM